MNNPAPGFRALLRRFWAWIFRPISTTCPRCGETLKAAPDGAAGGWCEKCQGEGGNA